MQNAIRAEIKRLCKRAFERAAARDARDQHFRNQYEKRTGLEAGIPGNRGKIELSRHFDPRHCMRNANFLAKTIWKKVLDNTYDPTPAARFTIPKDGGGEREIMAFSLPDAALANVVLRRARDRNIKRLSPSSFAYHPDKNVFDAILALREFDPGAKLFAVQIDFEKYFDNIPAWYIKTKIDDKSQISLTPHERFIFRAFLRHRYKNAREYSKQSGERRRLVGTPQGSSVSLLLANLANHDLDVKLSAQSGKFVRFADDVVALCENYSDAQALEACFFQHCRESGLKLNLKKSPGIAVISAQAQEIRAAEYFDYLGYRFRASGLSVPIKTERRLIEKSSRLINIYLINYIKGGSGFNQDRAGDDFDWDLLGLIYELRGVLYGGLSELQLERFLAGSDRLPRMKGLMGFYCLIDDADVLRRIDGTLLSLVRRAMKIRRSILQSQYGAVCPAPNNRELATGSWLNLGKWTGDDKPDPRMPSLVRGWRASRKHFFTFGLEQVEAPQHHSGSDLADVFEYI